MNALLLACPMCAVQQSNGIGTAVVLGLMILVPYAVSVVVIRAIRNAES